MLSESRQRGCQSVDKTIAKATSWPCFQRAEIQLQPNDGKVRVKRWADIDGAVEDFHRVLPNLSGIRTARTARRQLKLPILERVFMATTARIRAVLPDS